MLFNSLEFITLFLPLAVLCFYALNKVNVRLPVIGLVLFSFFFYAYWKPEYLLLLLASIGVNFVVARRIMALEDPKDLWLKKGLLISVIISNLFLIFYFKYLGFVIENTNKITYLSLDVPELILPIGISFFTFQQIAYQVDVYKGKASDSNFWNYCLFVSFFPQLIAGPIVHHSEMMPQFKDKAISIFKIENIVIGLTIFSIGLFKKVVIADTLSGYVSPIYGDALQGESIDFYAAWIAALGYTFQLYFDFSGYSDMAIGAARLFGICLPINFFSPYKSTSIIDFWRRWHMTLSRFFRDYIYIPLGGNRKGFVRQLTNVFITMVLVGIWHGAGWGFILWGTYHGALIVMTHFILEHTSLHRSVSKKTAIFFGFVTTFLLVVIGWVFFRAESLDAALIVLSGMFGLNGLSLPVHFFHFGVVPEGFGVVASVAGIKVAIWIMAAMFISFSLPNTAQLMRKFKPVLEFPAMLRGWNIVHVEWSPNVLWAGAAAIGILTAIGGILSGETEFLYFNF